MNEFMTTDEVETRTKYINLLVQGYTGTKKEVMTKQYEQSSTKSIINAMYNILDDILTYGTEQEIKSVLKLVQ